MIDDCFKFKGLKDCCIGCLNYEPKVTRWNNPNGLENWVHCARINECYAMQEILELEENERKCGD